MPVDKELREYEDIVKSYKEFKQREELEKQLALENKTRELVEDVYSDCLTQMRKWPAFNSAHEGYAILLEEVDELWEEVRKKQSNREVELMKKEALQVAAMALRFAVEVCNEPTIRK